MLNEDYEGNADEMYEYLETAIKKIAYEVVGVGKKRDYRTRWMTEEALQSKKRGGGAYERWLHSKQDEYRDTYKEKKKKATRKFTKAKKEMWDHTYSRIKCEMEFKG